MCDYSLNGTATRPAVVGDELVSTAFVSSLTRGFAASGEPHVAVCLHPGTELAFAREVEFEHPLRRLMPRLRFGKTGYRVARFRQVNMERSNTHHDALEFPGGKVVLLTRLVPGQRATVLQLPPAGEALRREAHEREQITWPLMIE